MYLTFSLESEGSWWVVGSHLMHAVHGVWVLGAGGRPGVGGGAVYDARRVDRLRRHCACHQSVPRGFAVYARQGMQVLGGRRVGGVGAPGAVGL